MKFLTYYKGYKGVYRLSSDPEENVLVGSIENTKDVITFISPSLKGMEKEMKISIDDYLLYCKKRGEKPSLL